MRWNEMKKSTSTALVAVFAAMIAVLDVIPMIPGLYSGIWDSWAFLLSPLVGIILGPQLGAASVLIGSLTGHLLYFRDPYELVFMWGAPICAAVTGQLYKGDWMGVFALYSSMLILYFLTPVTWLLPIWGVWDVIAGLGVLSALIVLDKTGQWDTQKKNDLRRALLVCIVGLEADILYRIFVFIPCQTYWLFYGLTPNQLQLLWLGAGFVTPFKVLLATLTVLALLRGLLPVLEEQMSYASQELE